MRSTSLSTACLVPGQWERLALDAAEFPHRLSVSYASDLRHLVQRRLEHELTLMGFSVRPAPSKLPRKNATILGCTPFTDPNGNVHDAEFCFRYGTDDYSFSSLNYRYDYGSCRRPARFVTAPPLLLGNFGLVISGATAPSIVYPPPEITLAGVAEVKSGATGHVIVWLGARYNVQRCCSWVVSELEEIELDDPIEGPDKPLTYVYASEFSRQFAGARYALSEEDERELRQRMGYPEKGKPIREQILYESVCAIFGGANVTRRYRGRELLGLEIDVWVPALQLGFEYQGQQHDDRLPHWQTEDDFNKQKHRDAKKVALARRLGIRLLHVGPRDELHREAILIKLRRLGLI